MELSKNFMGMQKIFLATATESPNPSSSRPYALLLPQCRSSPLSWLTSMEICFPVVPSLSCTFFETRSCMCCSWISYSTNVDIEHLIQVLLSHRGWNNPGVRVDLSISAGLGHVKDVEWDPVSSGTSLGSLLCPLQSSHVFMKPFLEEGLVYRPWLSPSLLLLLHCEVIIHFWQ